MALRFLKDRDENGMPGILGASAQGIAGEELVEVKDNNVPTLSKLGSGLGPVTGIASCVGHDKTAEQL